MPARFTPAELSDEEMKQCSFFSYPARFTRRMQNRYWNSLSYIDGLIRDLTDFLRERGLLDNTVLVIFGDHGEMFGENGSVTHATRLYEPVLHVPLIVWGAKRWQPREYSQPVSLLDIGPIVASLSGFPPYGGFQGQTPAGLDEPERNSTEAADPMERQDRGPQESVVPDCLRETLVQFRRNQLGYYANTMLLNTRFPPRHALAKTPACAVVASPENRN